MVFDVYIFGQLENYESLENENYDRSTLLRETLKFKILIGEPWYMVFNTAPTVDWIPY